MPFNDSDFDPQIDTLIFSGYPNYQETVLSSTEWIDFSDDLDAADEIVNTPGFRAYWKAKRLSERTKWEKFFFLNTDKWSREIASFGRLVSGISGPEGRLIKIKVASRVGDDRVYIPYNAVQRAERWIGIAAAYLARLTAEEKFKTSERTLTDQMH